MSQSGLLIIDKPAGMTSHDVVAKLRKVCKTKRVGHGGTLDPMATGLLIIGVEAGTKALQFVSSASKTYDASICLGVSTHTDDAEGDVISREDASRVSDEQIRAGLAAMVGEIDQVPSSVSAIKVDGQRAYDRVRAGENVELASRRVTLFRIDVHGIHRASDSIHVDVTVECSSGTYIRAIARDLGRELGVGGHLTSLRRTQACGYTVADARQWDEAGLEPLPLRQALTPFMSEVRVAHDELPKVFNGLNLPWIWNPVAGPVMVIDDSTDSLLAIGFESAGQLKYHSVFNQGLAD